MEGEANQRLAVKNPSGSLLTTMPIPIGSKIFLRHNDLQNGWGGGKGKRKQYERVAGGVAGRVDWMDQHPVQRVAFNLFGWRAKRCKQITHSPSGEYVNCLAGNNGGNATSSSTPGSVSSTISSSGGRFVASTAAQALGAVLEMAEHLSTDLFYFS